MRHLFNQSVIIKKHFIIKFWQNIRPEMKKKSHISSYVGPCHQPRSRQSQHMDNQISAAAWICLKRAFSHFWQVPRGIPFPILAVQLTLPWENVCASLWLHYFKGATYCFQSRESFGPTHTPSLTFPHPHLKQDSTTKKESDTERA